MGPKSKPICVVLAAFLLAACASSRPLLYPNPQLGNGASEYADGDIKACQDLATDNGTGVPGVPAETLTRAAVAVLRSVVTIVVGGDVVGAAQSMASSSANGLAKIVFGSSAEDPARRAFIEQCLQDKGYTLVGST